MVRNGYHPEREILSGIGPLSIKQHTQQHYSKWAYLYRAGRTGFVYDLYKLILNLPEMKFLLDIKGLSCYMDYTGEKFSILMNRSYFESLKL